MLPKASRLSSGDVDMVLSKGRSISIPVQNGQKSLISAKFLTTTGGFRAAAIVPKSIAKSAVARNRLRRAVYRAIAGLSGKKPSGIAIFFVRSIPKPPLTPSFASEISIFLQKIS